MFLQSPLICCYNEMWRPVCTDSFIRLDLGRWPGYALVLKDFETHSSTATPMTYSRNYRPVFSLVVTGCVCSCLNSVWSVWSLRVLSQPLASAIISIHPPYKLSLVNTSMYLCGGANGDSSVYSCHTLHPPCHKHLTIVWFVESSGLGPASRHLLLRENTVKY